MERGDLGIKAEVIRQALSVSVEAHTNPEGLPFVVRGIENSPSQVIVAFAGSWSPDDWFAGDGEAKPFGEAKIDDKKFPSLRSEFPSLRRLGTDAFAVVNEGFAARFLRILEEDGNQTFRKEVAKAVADGKQITFSGYSSGGPIAIYATVWFLEKYIRSNEKQTSRPRPRRPLCLTFGSPLTTDRTFCHAVQRDGWSDCFVHFVAKLDMVPRILLTPRSSATELLREIPPFFDPHHKADRAKLASLFGNVMKNAACAASYAACAVTGSKHTLFDTMSRFIKRSPYQPCGQYVFFTETGRLVVVKNPDAVLQLLFYSLQIESETELPKIAVASLEAHWTYRDALDRCLATHNVVCLENLRDLPLSSDDPVDINVKTIGAALNDLNLSTTARLCLRAAGELEKQKEDNRNAIQEKKDAINKALKALEEYRTTCRNDGVGYYDAFKMQKKEEDFKANVKRLELAAMWDEIIEMIKQERLPDKFEAEKEWVDLGTLFRRLVEPVDIANYYRHMKNEDAGPYMTKGRPKRYHYPQRWREHAEQLDRDSSGESCFLAEVEDLNVEVANKKPWTSIKDRVLDLEKKLNDWKAKKEVNDDVFLDKSTLVEWWRKLPREHKAKSCIKGLMESQT
ncbi:protein EDS1-like isoform X2 [Rhodamnia argentea]|uniref:Protein EDS1-like isoform X2 n=1 Tax=Rhodamnia argentea TaxID=178133 RepID=A0ABM3HLV0_9MYRT|nr:protein EDS1-like isoform X2 [Rhodamnia argentea]